MPGFVEAILLLLGLADFRLQPNPAPPTPDAALHYAMPDADLVVHVDAVSFVPNNYKALLALANQPQIKASPELSKMLREVTAEVDGMRGIARSTVGIDPVADVYDATISVQLAGAPEPLFVAAVHGKFQPASLDKIARMGGGQVTKIGGGAMVELGANQPAIGLTKDGVLLGGTPRLVRERLADTWKPLPRVPGSAVHHAAEVIANRPVFAVAFGLSPAARKMIVDKHGKKDFGTDLVQRHKVGSLAVYHDGIGWSWTDRDRAGLDAMAQFSEGAIDLMRAGQVAPRGIAKLFLGAIDSYRGTDKRLDEVIKRKADIVKIVDTYTGDGNFKVSINKNPTAFRLDVRASAKSLSEVVPVGFILPLAAVGLVAGRAQASPPMQMPAPARTMAPPPPPGKAAQPAPAPPPAKKAPAAPPPRP